MGTMRYKVPRFHPNVIKRLPIGLALTIGALGVVFGDIGTSPLYAVHQAFFGIGHLPVNRENVLGVIGLIFWLLTLIVSILYMFFVLRADNQGEGGVFSLYALLKKVYKRRTALISVVLVFAASLLFGDAIITPAISVLSAVEGLKVGTDLFEPYILYITVAILTGLFMIQRKGTSSIGKIFGPIMLVWFVVIGLLGAHAVIKYPAILDAINPIHAFNLAVSMGPYAFLLVIGAVTLAVTGVEALYADLGHFGTRPIRMGWFMLAYWALLLNYLGQGASLLTGQAAASQNVFFSLLPKIDTSIPLLANLPPSLQQLIVNMPVYAMVALATVATVIASQALITGLFSLTSQAIALGMAPRITIKHTNANKFGQIYVPAINWALLVGCLCLVFVFRSSDNLAAAYGMAVSGVMLCTAVSMTLVARDIWQWPRWRVLGLFGLFSVIIGTIFVANSLKFLHGGYIPVIIGILLFGFLVVWQWGRNFVQSAYEDYALYSGHHSMPWLTGLKSRIKETGRIKDRARYLVELDRAVVFLVSKPVNRMSDLVPVIIRIYIKRHGGIPRYVFMLNMVQETVPYVASEKRIQITDFSQNVYMIKAHYGFMQQPDGLDLLRSLKTMGMLPVDLQSCSIESSEEEIFMGRHTPLIVRIRAEVYHYFERITQPAYHYFRLDRKPGLTKTIIPILLNERGWRIDLPEFTFDRDKEHIDPDKLVPTDLQYHEHRKHRNRFHINRRPILKHRK